MEANIISSDTSFQSTIVIGCLSSKWSRTVGNRQPIWLPIITIPYSMKKLNIKRIQIIAMHCSLVPFVCIMHSNYDGKRM